MDPRQITFPMTFHFDSPEGAQNPTIDEPTPDTDEGAIEPPSRKSLDEIPIEENPDLVEEIEEIVQRNRVKSVVMEAAARQLERRKKIRNKKKKKKVKETKKEKKVEPTKKPKPKKNKSEKSLRKLPEEYKDIQYFHGVGGTTFRYAKIQKGYLVISRKDSEVQIPWNDLLQFIAKEVIAKRLHKRIDELTPEELIGIPNLIMYPPDLQKRREKAKKAPNQDHGELFEMQLRNIRGQKGHSFPNVKDPPPFMRNRRRKKDAPDFSHLVMTKELLEILDIRPPTLFNWRDSGFFPEPKKVEGKNYWPKEVVKNWLQTHYKRNGRWYAKVDKDPRDEFIADQEDDDAKAWEKLIRATQERDFG